MLSSKVQEIKQDAKEVAEDISARTQEVASDVTLEAREAASNVGDRVAREGVEIKSELEVLFGKIYDLLRPDASQDLRQQVRHGVEDVSRKVTAWAREGELKAALGTTQLRTRQTVNDHPMATLLVAAGAGAMIAYWLSHRHSSQPDQPN